MKRKNKGSKRFPYLRLPRFGGAFFMGFGGAFRETAPPGLGGTARIKHLGSEPIKSSRWAFISASRTK